MSHSAEQAGTGQSPSSDRGAERVECASLSETDKVPLSESSGQGHANTVQEKLEEEAAMAEASPDPVPTGPYAFDDVLANFRALLQDVDFSREMQLLGIKRFAIMRRRAMLLELRALYVGLWFLAMRRSFPDTAEHIFQLFLKGHAQKRLSKRDALFRERAVQYRDMLVLSGDKDFTAVSRHLLSFSPTEEGELKARSLRVALNLRSTYTFIFERLL